MTEPDWEDDGRALPEPYLRKTDDELVVTDAGRKYLERIVTDVDGPVYAFTSEASPLMVSAAMARLSRRGSDMRQIYLDEFATVGPAEAGELIDRVVTQYGDDSVQQLVGLQLVVEGASNLLTKQLEWGRLMSYLEQSTRYIFFDQQDGGRYKFYTPPNLGLVTKRYDDDLTIIFDTYSQMVRDLTAFVRERHPQGESDRTAWLSATRAQACDAVRPVLPVATKSTVGIYGSAQAFDNLIMRLLGEELAEFTDTGQRILAAVRQVQPEFFRRTDMPHRGGAITAYRADTRQAMRELADDLDLSASNPDYELVRLVSYWPGRELDLAGRMLFEFADTSKLRLNALGDEAAETVLRTYFGNRGNRRHRPGRALEYAHFEWEIIGDYGTFRDLQRHRMVDDFSWQELTPQYGYDVPALVAEAGQETAFRDCFGRAEALYEHLLAQGFEPEAQYATLLGHRMRYSFTANLRSLFHILELRTTPQGHPGYRKICQEMHRQLAQVYPMSAAAMSFVGQGEDPALTRLDAELATQRKLADIEARQR